MANPTSYEYDIFLSHNHRDQEWTAKLAERLEQEDWQGRKLRVFFSPWDIRPGQSIPLEIERALPKSRKVGLVMSPEAIASAWVELERLVTTHIAMSAREERLIPLLRRACDIPALVQHLLYIDFTEDDQFDESYQRLLSVIKDEPTPRRAAKSVSAPISLPPSIPRPPIVGFVARRDRDGHDIVERLRDELTPQKNQLVALWGAGGVGKTTLASEAARALTGDFAQRIVWVSADQRANLPFTTFLDEIAAQLGDEDLRRLALEQKVEGVRALIAAAPTLIVLDNFETIAPEDQLQCIEFLAERARSAALITTRQRIAHAVSVPIAAMSTEEANDFLLRLINQTQDPDIYAELDRKRLIQMAEANPLIIEWIVGQIDLANDPEEVLDELSHGEGDAAQRVFDRSFNLRQMADGGRAVLLALSLFTPSATRSALAEVAGMGKDKDKKRFKKAQETLASLWLIKKTEAGQRLSVAGLTRELTKAHLYADPRDKTFRQRFTARFLKYAQANQNPTPEYLNALEEEKDNILSALDVTLEINDGNSLMRILLAMDEFLRLRGYWDESIRRGEQALEVARKLSGEDWIRLFTHNLALVHQSRGNLSKARELYDESLEIERKFRNQSGIATTLYTLGTLAQDQGELKEARRLYDESLDIKKRLGDQSGIALTLHALGSLAQNQGELEEARQLYDKSLEIGKRLGDQIGISASLHQMATLAYDQGELEEARRLYDESLEIMKRLGDQRGIATSLHQLGMVCLAEGNFEGSESLLNQSLIILRKLSHKQYIAECLESIGSVRTAQGSFVEAHELFNESLGMALSLRDKFRVASVRRSLGLLAEKENELTKALELLREALSVFESLKSPKAEKTRRDLERIEKRVS